MVPNIKQTYFRKTINKKILNCSITMSRKIVSQIVFSNAFAETFLILTIQFNFVRHYNYLICSVLYLETDNEITAKKNNDLFN